MYKIKNGAAINLMDIHYTAVGWFFLERVNSYTWLLLYSRTWSLNPRFYSSDCSSRRRTSCMCTRYLWTRNTGLTARHTRHHHLDTQAVDKIARSSKFISVPVWCIHNWKWIKKTKFPTWPVLTVWQTRIQIWIRLLDCTQIFSF